MAEKPILFSAPMIRALMAGTKTQTRRSVKPQPPEGIVRHCWYDAPLYGFTKDRDVSADWHIARLLACKGDRLWVREAWKPHSTFDHLPPRDIPQSKVFYLADGGYSPSGSRGRPGIFMPRWASRLTLTVADVRVERLQDISRDDAIAEGLIKDQTASPLAVEMGCDWSFEGDTRFGSPVSAYAALWDHINGAGAWVSNPWVVAYTFTVQHKNIDRIAQ